jgi:predicted glycogen debranching enzyme
MKPEGGDCMKMTFSRRDLRKRMGETMPEWALGDGLGGFSSGSADDALFRKHHGYLVVSRKPPVDRVVVLAKTTEQVKTERATRSFAAAHYQDGTDVVNRFQTGFECDPVPTYRNGSPEVTFTKTIVPIRGKNAVFLRYVITANEDLVFRIEPWINHRDHTAVSAKGDHRFMSRSEYRVAVITDASDRSFRLVFQASIGTFRSQDNGQTKPLRYPFDEATGDTRADVHFTPIVWEASMSAQTTQTVDFLVSYGDSKVDFAEDPIEAYRKRLDDLVRNAEVADWFEDALIRSSDMFVAHRRSTNKPTVLAGIPWFTDWGRDTMIAFPGLFLSTKRYAEGRLVLESFLDYQKDGLIPNMFPDDNAEPLYNTVDASLWFVHAGWRYWQETGDDEFVRSRLLPSWIEILSQYRKGTRFSIGMDADGLIRAGSGNDQVTWMDVRINGYAVTPRHGKPVEINALWYHALRIVAELSRRYGREDAPWLDLAQRVKASFLKRFPSSQGGLKDVVDPDDESIRPNQLVAVILPYSMLDQSQKKAIVALAKAKLLDHYAIRSLAYDDPRFKQVHKGPLILRDHNYHMGTSWAYLMGFYLEAVLIAEDNTEQARAEVRAVYDRLKTHLFRESLFGVAEIFDGFEGTVSRGCHNQAWSVAEWLRVYKDYRIGGIRP